MLEVDQMSYSLCSFISYLVAEETNSMHISSDNFEKTAKKTRERRRDRG